MIQSKEIEYKVHGLNCRAFVAYDANIKKPKPCVMIAPDWSGRSEVFCNKAKQLAELGFVGVAIDMYGDAKTGNNKEENQALLAPVMADRHHVAERMSAALSCVQSLSEVDAGKIAAMGYCFGGLCVLDLARSGANLLGVISFHGLLTSPEYTMCTKIRAKVLVLHGYDDPMVPPKQVQTFAAEMTRKKVDWQIHMYGHTQHAFTNPNAHDDDLGLHYNANADHRSWHSAMQFLNELF